MERDARARAWDDEIIDDEEEPVEDDTRLYPDGSVQEECWAVQNEG